MRPSLEEQLERIISGAALIADSGSTRDDRKSRIVQECNKVRQALQDLLKQYEENVCVIRIIFKEKETFTLLNTYYILCLTFIFGPVKKYNEARFRFSLGIRS